MIFSIDLYSTKRNTFILKCLIQFTCIYLDGCQKEGSNFFNLLQKEGVPRREGVGVPSEREGGSTLEGTMTYALSNQEKVFFTMRTM